MKFRKLKLLIFVPVLISAFFIVRQIAAQIELPIITTACENKNGQLYAFNDGFSKLTECDEDSRRVVQLGERQDLTPYQIQDIGFTVGSIWSTPANTENVPTPDKVTVTCSSNCYLLVHYDVDTRNTEPVISGIGHQHLYFIYVNGRDYALFNQATMTVPGAAIPLALNGTFVFEPGTYEVQIYTRVYSGILEQHESHLQVMAVSR